MADGVLESLLVRSEVRRLAGEPAFARGEEYFEQGCVDSFQALDQKVGALVRGSEIYRVYIGVSKGELDFSCTCPVGVGGGFCKHCAAVALKWLSETHFGISRG